MDTAQLIQIITINALPVIFAITLHEAAHGWMAARFGDTTARSMGRVTLNPMPHIDLMGTIVMPVLLFFATGGRFLFGYAKPVPVQFGRLRHPKRDMIWVALAGPAMNFAQAFLWASALLVLLSLGVNETFFIEMCKAGVRINAAMFAFNLFPLPPLDGGRIVFGLLPSRLAWQFAKIEPWGFYIVMALIVLNVISSLWMSPLMDLTFALLNVLLAPLQSLLPN